MKKEVPTETLRRAVADSGLNYTEVARRLGWMHPDAPRLKRALGVMTGYTYNGKPHRVASTSYERAVEIVRACGLDPVDYDL